MTKAESQALVPFLKPRFAATDEAPKEQFTSCWLTYFRMFIHLWAQLYLNGNEVTLWVCRPEGQVKLPLPLKGLLILIRSASYCFYDMRQVFRNGRKLCFWIVPNSFSSAMVISKITWRSRNSLVSSQPAMILHWICSFLRNDLKVAWSNGLRFLSRRIIQAWNRAKAPHSAENKGVAQFMDINVSYFGSK